jgi:hypothetical protein
MTASGREGTSEDEALPLQLAGGKPSSLGVSGRIDRPDIWGCAATVLATAPLHGGLAGPRI